MVHRCLDGAGKCAQGRVEGQLSGIGHTEVVESDGSWARLKGQAQRVVLVADSVSGLIYPPIVAGGEEADAKHPSAGPWQRLFDRAGLGLDALRDATSDDAGHRHKVEPGRRIVFRQIVDILSTMK